MMEWTAFEDQARAEGYTCICGIDEAGRGPLAGPVYAAAVVLRPGQVIEGVNDSKKLSEKKRDSLFDTICSQCAAYGIGSATEKEIDEVNILNATYLAMQRAVAALPVQPDCALVDGNRAPDLPWRCARSLRATPKAPALRQRLFWLRSAGIAICCKWQRNTRNTLLKSTRATAPSCIMNGWSSTGSAPFTGCRS